MARPVRVRTHLRRRNSPGPRRRTIRHEDEEYFEPGEFLWNEHRRFLAGRLDAVVGWLRKNVPQARELAVYGSFVSAKEFPKDVDIVVRIEGPAPALSEKYGELNNIKRADVDLITIPSRNEYEKFLDFARLRGRIIRVVL